MRALLAYQTYFPAFFKEFDNKIEEQLVAEVVNNALATMPWTEFYISYKLVVKQSAKSTKLQIVYDALAKPTKTRWSTNECLEVRSWSIIAKQFLECTYKIMIETICYNRRPITSIYSYEAQQKWPGCYEISQDQTSRNTRETGTLIHKPLTVTWFTCFGCCHHHLWLNLYLCLYHQMSFGAASASNSIGFHTKYICW